VGCKLYNQSIANQVLKYQSASDSKVERKWEAETYPAPGTGISTGGGGISEANGGTPAPA